MNFSIVSLPVSPYAFSAGARYSSSILCVPANLVILLIVCLNRAAAQGGKTPSPWPGGSLDILVSCCFIQGCE